MQMAPPGWCKGFHSPKRPAQGGYEGFCAKCFRKRFPRKHAKTKSRLGIWCDNCYEPQQLKSGVCASCLDKGRKKCTHCERLNFLVQDVCSEPQCSRNLRLCTACYTVHQSSSAIVCGVCRRQKLERCDECGTQDDLVDGNYYCAESKCGVRLRFCGSCVGLTERASSKMFCKSCWREAGKFCVSCGIAKARCHRGNLRLCYKCATNFHCRRTQEPVIVSSEPDNERSVRHGCSSCGLLSHSDCRSPLCPHTPCGICLSNGLVTHSDSERCRQEQMRSWGCHECGRFECFSYAPDCHARCTRFNHVCTPNSGLGHCGSCDRACHTTNADPRCPFFQRKRGSLEWVTTNEDLKDTMAGAACSLPHRSQVSWNYIDGTSKEVLVDKVTYRIGVGCPGDPNHGEHNNCLIDSLRQCLGNLQCDRKLVRQDLINKFGDVPAGDSRREVTQSSYLDVEMHWQEILCSLFRHNESGRPTSCDPDEYCIVALYGTKPGEHGTVVGRKDAPYRLVIINWNDNHFDPCLLN